MIEEQRLATTIELVEKARARLDQAQAMGLPPSEREAEFEDITKSVKALNRE